VIPDRWGFFGVMGDICPAFPVFLQETCKFAKANPDFSALIFTIFSTIVVLVWKFGSRCIILCFRFGRWCVRQISRHFSQSRRRSLADEPLANVSPFEVIRPHSPQVVKQLLGSQQLEDNPLADFNILYQSRLRERSVRQELEQHLDTKGWVLILGKTGLGKTREAAELASTLNHEGWTIIRLTNWQRVDVPERFPEAKMGGRHKLLFVLDDLNQPMYLNKLEVERTKGKSDFAQVFKATLPERLLQMLLYFEEQCRAAEIRVLATARNETQPEPREVLSEWDKLEIERYPQFWQRFEQYVLPEPEDQIIVDLLSQTVLRAGIRAKETDFERIAQHNDRTFRNVVLNLISAQQRNQELNAQTFNSTLRGNWAQRYQRMTQKYKFAAAIYDAVDLLRQGDVELQISTLESVAILLANCEQWYQVWPRRKLLNALRFLVESEGLLAPRDGQIEAKGYVAELGEYVPKLTHILLRIMVQQPGNMWFSILNFGDRLSGLGRYPQSLKCFEATLSILMCLVENSSDAELVPELKSLIARIWLRHGNVLFLLGDEDNAVGDVSQANQKWTKAINSYKQAQELNPDDPNPWLMFGLKLSDRKHSEDAIKVYDELITRFSNHTDLAVLEALAKALFFKGMILDSLDRTEEVIVVCDELITRFVSHTEIPLLERLADALFLKGVSLNSLGRTGEAITAYNELITLFFNHTELPLLERFADALFLKGISLSSLGHAEEAITAYNELITLFSSHTEFPLFKKLVDALFLKGLTLVSLGRTEEAEQSVQQILEIVPMDWRANDLLIILLVFQRKWAELWQVIPAWLTALDKEKAVPETNIDMLLLIAANGHAAKVLKIVVESSMESKLISLVIGLQIFLGEQPQAAQEILEIGQDVAQRIREKQQALKQSKAVS
jgi:tetratricopeptide (TPR) repeat protein